MDRSASIRETEGASLDQRSFGLLHGARPIRPRGRGWHLRRERTRRRCHARTTGGASTSSGRTTKQDHSAAEQDDADASECGECLGLTGAREDLWERRHGARCRAGWGGLRLSRRLLETAECLANACWLGVSARAGGLARWNRGCAWCSGRSSGAAAAPALPALAATGAGAVLADAGIATLTTVGHVSWVRWAVVGRRSLTERSLLPGCLWVAGRL
jgi:hypothetical protein